MQFKFISRWKSYTLVLEPKKTREGEVVTEGKVAEFNDYFYETADEEIAEKIRKGPSFGADYWEYGQPVPATVKKVPPAPMIGEVEKMPSEKAKDAGMPLDAISERFKSIETMVLEVAKTVDNLAKQVSGDAEESDSKAPAKEKKQGKGGKNAKKEEQENEENDKS